MQGVKAAFTAKICLPWILPETDVKFKAKFRALII